LVDPKSAYYHLKNIARIRCFVSSQDLEKRVHAFTSRVDYCNGLLIGLPKKTRQLQLIQNAAARILSRTENVNISHQSSGLYIGSQLHLGLILKYNY